MFVFLFVSVVSLALPLHLEDMALTEEKYETEQSLLTNCDALAYFSWTGTDLPLDVMALSIKKKLTMQQTVYLTRGRCVGRGTVATKRRRVT